jgi:hypothetical protein
MRPSYGAAFMGLIRKIANERLFSQTELASPNFKVRLIHVSGTPSQFHGPEPRGVSSAPGLTYYTVR